MQKDLREILDAGIAAADPYDAVKRYLKVEDDRISAGGASFEAGRVFALAAGKAAGPMARAAEELLGGKLAGGILVTKDDHDAGPESLETFFASHPEPDERGVKAARKAQELAESLEEGDLLLALISGGASALLADPAPPVEIEDLKQLTSELLKSGADIEEINTVRKHLSVLKGGGLVDLAHPAPTLALLLSDVVGDTPSSIASGLTTPDPTTLEDTHEVLKRCGIEPPETVKQLLKQEKETPKPGDRLFEDAVTVVCGGGRPASEAAAEKARGLGYEPLILSTLINDDARNVATMYAAIIREVLESGNPLPTPCALVSGGEATVVVRGDGVGGPNQEFALALAVQLDGVEGWAAIAADTDGADGSTDVAGGMVDGSTAREIREKDIDPGEALSNNDAHTALEAASALVVTGPTGTNVNDLRVALLIGGPDRPVG
ncbi:MAG TPA: glycerate kinase [Rubrobacteraceae bacterium]|nr:glycerate kinase [Rubrobacteraceae bacterium]